MHPDYSSLTSLNWLRWGVFFVEGGERGAKSAVLGRDVLGGSFPPKARLFARLNSPFLTGNPSKGESQVEHLFKTAGSEEPGGRKSERDLQFVPIARSKEWI
jgi:hypothetical protein